MATRSLLRFSLGSLFGAAKEFLKFSSHFTASSTEDGLLEKLYGSSASVLAGEPFSLIIFEIPVDSQIPERKRFASILYSVPQFSVPSITRLRPLFSFETASSGTGS